MSALLRLAGLRWPYSRVPVLRGLRRPSMADLERSEGAVDALAGAADLVVSGAVVVTLRDWRRLSVPERAALVAARTRHTASLVASLAASIASPEAAAVILGIADGGQARRQGAMRSAVAEVVRTLEGRRGGA